MNEINGYDMVCRIDNLLKSMGKTREDLASFIGKNKQVFTDWKNVGIIPKADDLFKMSRWLGVPMEYLLTGENVIPDDVAIAASLIQSIPPEKRPPVIASIKAQAELLRN